MIHERMEKALNEQINAELHSAYLYLSMVSYFEDQSLNGFAQYMKVQAQEEMLHAQAFFNHLIERGGRVRLAPIEGPQTDWKSVLEAFEAALAHEQYISGRINKLMDLAKELGDHASVPLLHWFVNEQVEEESNADDVVKKLRLIGDVGHGIFMMDRELGQRIDVITVTNPIVI